MILALFVGALLQAGPPQSKADSITEDILRRLRIQDSIRANRLAALSDERRERDRRQLREVTPADLATAFKDPAAKVLLERARVARMGQDSALVAYDAQSYQRVSAGISFTKIGRDRLVFRMEHAGRVRWQRDVGIWIDLTGARTVMHGTPDIAQREAGKGLAEAGADIVPVPYFPGYEPLLPGPLAAEAEVDDDGPVHPLAIGAEAYYTYRSGDSITLTLPDQRTYRLHSLEVRPRFTEWRLMVGTMWFDINTAQLVRAAYRFAAPMNIDRFVLEQDPTAFDDVPAFVKPMMFPMKGEVTSVTIEYGLYGGRFWLPRSRTAAGQGQASFVRVPFQFEQRFTYNSVNGRDTLPTFPPLQNNSVTIRIPPGLSDSARREFRDSVFRATMRAGQARRDSITRGLLRRPIRLNQCDTSDVRVNSDRQYGQSRTPYATRRPCDLSTLVNSPDLPASIYEPGEEVFDIKARDALVQQALSMSAQSEFTLNPRRMPRPDWQPWLGQVRYNRVEGPSFGADVSQMVGGGYSARLGGRFGFADQRPNVELQFMRTNQSRTFWLGGYTRLVAANDWGTPLTFGSSLPAFFFGRDEGFYYRVAGVEFGGRTEFSPNIDWRMFTERHRTASVGTQFAIASTNSLANIVASEARYTGLGMRVRGSHGEDPQGFRVFGDARFESAIASADSLYARAALDLTFTQGFGHWGTALTLSGGGSVGALPSQRRFYLGGTRSIRGQTPDTAQSGNAYWMSRLEIARTIQGSKAILFSDLGWAGDRARIREVGRPMSGFGLGISILDGLMRFDIGRGVYPRKQMRIDAYLDGLF